MVICSRPECQTTIGCICNQPGKPTITRGMEWSISEPRDKAAVELARQAARHDALAAQLETDAHDHRLAAQRARAEIKLREIAKEFPDIGEHIKAAGVNIVKD